MQTVYIVGGDHHNGYGLARQFGMKHIPVTAIIISNRKTTWISKSKYIKETYIFESEKAAFDYLAKKNTNTKDIIIPYSDKAALELDNRLYEFDGKYYVPSFNHQEHVLERYMDKAYQARIANEFGIKTADTVVLDTSSNTDNFTFKYPCIIKPRASAFGKKEDIRLCENKEQLIAAINEYKRKGYIEAIIQEYLKIDYEIDVFGGIANGEIASIFPHQIIRRWPIIGGTCSFTKTIIDQKLFDICRKILKMLVSMEYSGLYDMELFYVNGEYVFNEINFRNSGSGYRGISQGFFYAVDWIEKMSGTNIDHNCMTPSLEEYTMTEYTDIRNVITGSVSLGTWINDFYKSRCYSIINVRDIKPFFAKLTSSRK